MWVCYCASQLLAQNCHKRQMTECPKSPEWDQNLSHMPDWPFSSLCKETVSNPFTKMLAHWWRISPIMLCDTMKAFHHQRAGGLAWGTHKQEPLPSGRTFLQPFPSSTLRFPLPLLCLSLRFCLIMTYLKTRWVDYLEGWLLQMFLVIQMQILALKCPAHHNTYWISWSWPSML